MMCPNKISFRVAPVLVFAVGLSVCLTASETFGQQKRADKRGYPPQLKNAKVEVYKTIGEVRLNIYQFFPADHQSTDKRPAIVFFFGGGWRGGSPGQFEKQCEYLASRGMVAMAADYRVRSRHGVKANSCVADAKSAVRWIRANAERLGIDAKKIVAAGGSAGGHIAACTGTISILDEQNEDATISSKPNAMVLFNPAVVLAAIESKPSFQPKPGLEKRTGVPAIEISPYHHIAAKQPPSLILHGKDDPTVPYQTVAWFAEAMTAAGNRCELAGYAGEKHGFFNYGRRKNKAFIATLERTDQFLSSLGYLQGESTVAEFLKQQTE